VQGLIAQMEGALLRHLFPSTPAFWATPWWSSSRG